MRINTNIAAMNTQRLLAQTNAQASQSIARLSSGFRINQSSDDAAGLGIANKLRAELFTLNQAHANTEQARAMLQTAEGGANTIAEIVDRMKELAAQAASSNSGDRAIIDAEFQTLRSEIGRIVDTTHYQGTNLIDGSMGTAVDTDPANSTLLNSALVHSVQNQGAQAGTYAVSWAAADDEFTITSGGVTETVDMTGREGIQTVVSQTFGFSFETTAAFELTSGDFSGNVVVTGTANGFLVSSSGAYGTNDQVGVDASKLALDASSLGIGASSLATQSDAQTALGALDTAISQLNEAFGEIGSVQNQLQFAAQNVLSAIENFTAAESTIRDADMAAEMTEFTRLQILQQAGTAMLAQANHAPSQVLQLLQ